ncbi:DNA-processing protein DprA [Buchananella hordeovulneris]|uniref:DNA-processing protein DprA n=1 Tax=Buchananella hordeovulneris TaxID=52770 RepID=UPI000F5D996E|nr:DNA-processing protein DprA [Buchananella hordeovulneris]RRD44916.1 DNA-protecting protein DprA [Buchananella hordeovulneris]
MSSPVVEDGLGEPGPGGAGREATGGASAGQTLQPAGPEIGQGRGPGADATDPDATGLAVAAWSRLTEPGDRAAHALVGALGYREAWRWVQRQPDPAAAWQLTGAATVRQWATALARWRPRLATVEPAQELHAARLLGATLLWPGRPGWSPALADLGPDAPLALWVRGEVELLERAAVGGVALVGARAATKYGQRIATHLAEGLAGQGGAVVVSGGAYGIDAAAHAGALAIGGATVAFLAGGLDRLYPVGNRDLLQRISRAGALVSECPPGTSPSRVRFLLRNRLIAAATRATIVVEAAARSGALNTARQATDLLRPVGAVPGPLGSDLSVGCHGLIRDGATLIGSVADARELLGPIAVTAAPGNPDDGVVDGLRDNERRVYDALPTRAARPADALAASAGLSVAEVRASLGVLALLGKVERTQAGQWRRT